jgi:hypothetical protein
MGLEPKPAALSAGFRSAGFFRPGGLSGSSLPFRARLFPYFNALLPGFGKPDGDRLFAAFGVSLAAFHLPHFVPDIFACLG